MITVDLDLADLVVAHEVFAGMITSTEKIGTDLAAHAEKLSPGILDEVIDQVNKRVAALRRVSDALFDAELELRFPK